MTSFSISLNDESVGYFAGKRGLRQVDAISSSLFALATDIMSKNINSATRSNLLWLHPLCVDPLITHLSFADDVLVFFDGLVGSLAAILQVLRRFYFASGLQLNIRNFCLFLDGNNQLLTWNLAAKFRLTHGSLPVRYMRLPLLPQKWDQMITNRSQ